ncbi:MAG: hypothetical protein JNL44_04140, partial [Gemmatimonadetes bacterium]|nr:hypothetical protein [Gemmatimonadota bacterium]
MADRNSHWQQIVREAWGLEGELTPLPGEFDLNFRLRASDGRHLVLKVMRASCEAGLVDLLCAAHTHVLARGAHPVPAIVPTLKGAQWCSRPDERGDDRLLWMLTGLDGMDYARFRPHTLALARELGGRIARLDAALEGFEHPQLARELKWDLSRAEWIAGHLTRITDPGRRALLDAVVARYRAVQPRLAAERRTLLMPDRDPSLEFVQGGSVLCASALPKLNVQGCNVERPRLRLL